VEPGGLATYQEDEESLAALADVTRILLKDRQRMRAKMAAAQTTRLHAIVTEEFKKLQRTPDASEDVEDATEEKIHGLGFSLDTSQKRQFAVDRQCVSENRGPSEAAAKALAPAIGRKAWRTVYNAKRDARTQSPVPGPLNRFVPIDAVRQYVNAVFAHVEQERRQTAPLPLEALTSDEHIEELTALVEVSFQDQARQDLKGAIEGFAPVFLALLRGDDPPSTTPQPPDIERAFATVRIQLAALGKRIIRSLPAGDEIEQTAVLNGVALWLAESWIYTLRSAASIE
jgi:hypothetical protein